MGMENVRLGEQDPGNKIDKFGHLSLGYFYLLGLSGYL